MIKRYKKLKVVYKKDNKNFKEYKKYIKIVWFKSKINLSKTSNQNSKNSRRKCLIID